jgi:hypothetical protein
MDGYRLRQHIESFTRQECLTLLILTTFSVSEKLLSFEESTLVNVELSFKSDEARWTRAMYGNQKSHISLDGL